MRRHAFGCAVLLASSLLVPARAAIAEPRFSAMDNTVIRVYFATRPVVWSGMPPAVARAFARGKALPPGAELHPLPPDLLAKLPVRSGFEYARVGGDIALIHVNTQIVVDVIENVFE